MNKEEIENLKGLIYKRDELIQERERELSEKYEEINAQKEELTAAIDQLIMVNEQLVEKNNELDQILYKSSHDLISPIISIEGILGLIKNTEKSNNIIEFISHISLQNNKMKVVVSALNALMKINQESWQPEIISLFETTKSAVESLFFLSNYESVNISFQIEKSLKVKIDKQIFEIIIKNFVSNSINYRTISEIKGIVNISIKNIKNKLIIEIEDDGEGISTEISTKIYDIFYRGTVKSTGLGLGLYFIKKIAQRMNGELFYKTNEKNTIFCLSLKVS